VGIGRASSASTIRSAASSTDRKATWLQATRTHSATRAGSAQISLPDRTVKSGNDHFANFINCVRSRNAAELRAPIEEGHVSCALVHLANASYRLGRSLPFDPATELVVDDEEANRILAGEDRLSRTVCHAG